jgi:flagellar protein FliL
MAEKEETEQTEENKEDKKSKPMMLIIIIIVVIVLIIIGIVVTVLLMGGKKHESEGGHTTHQQVQVRHVESPETKKLVSEFGQPVTLKNVGVLYPLDTFTVNLMSNGGERYLKTAMSLELSDKHLVEELNARKAVIRDKIIRLLSSKTFQEIATIQGKNKLSQQITDLLNTMLSDGTVRGVFFTEFVVQ